MTPPSRQDTGKHRLPLIADDSEDMVCIARLEERVDGIAQRFEDKAKATSDRLEEKTRAFEATIDKLSSSFSAAVSRLETRLSDLVTKDYCLQQHKPMEAKLSALEAKAASSHESWLMAKGGWKMVLLIVAVLVWIGDRAFAIWETATGAQISKQQPAPAYYILPQGTPSYAPKPDAGWAPIMPSLDTKRRPSR